MSFVATVDPRRPPFHELERRFDSVHSFFGYGTKQFQSPPDGQLERPPAERRFVVFTTQGFLAVQMFDPLPSLKLRPALYVEGLSFAAAHPQEQLNGSIAIPGAFARVNGEIQVAALGRNVGRRVLEMIRRDELMELPTFRYLFVSMEEVTEIDQVTC
jgi:hypothetical protein